MKSSEWHGVPNSKCPKYNQTSNASPCTADKNTARLLPMLNTVKCTYTTMSQEGLKLAVPMFEIRKVSEIGNKIKYEICSTLPPI